MARFYLDHNVAYDVAFGLRQHGHEAHTARDLHLSRAEDDNALLIAAGNGWIVISHDAEDFSLLHSAWRRWSEAWGVRPPPQHAGILILPPVRPERTVREVTGLLQTGQQLANELYTWRLKRGWMPGS